MTVWTDERVKSLEKLWSDGYSASQIAGYYGDVTRNAVISKVHRLGLPAKGIRKTNPKTLPTVTRPSMKTHRMDQRISELRHLKAQMQRADHQQTPADTEAPEPLNLMLKEREKGQCAWPVNDGDPFLFCGHPTTEGSAYCGYHARKLVPSKPAPKRVVKPFRRAA